MKMRQTDYTISKTKVRIDKYSNMLRLAIIVRADVAILIRLQRKCRKCKEDLLKLKERKQHMKSINFNLNAYSNEECLKQFRFFPAEIKKVSDIIGFSGGCTARSRYACDQLTPCCIILRRLAAPCRWLDLEPIFGMRLSVLSEVFWEGIKHFVDV